jgi:hypothetical protein
MKRDYECKVGGKITNQGAARATDMPPCPVAPHLRASAASSGREGPTLTPRPMSKGEMLVPLSQCPVLPAARPLPGSSSAGEQAGDGRRRRGGRRDGCWMPAHAFGSPPAPNALE